MLVKLEHPEKHKEPKDVTEDGIVMLVKLEQYKNILLVDYQYYTL